jgi:hypothetical protein
VGQFTTAAPRMYRLFRSNFPTSTGFIMDSIEQVGAGPSKPVAIPHDDGSFFDDGSGYSNGPEQMPEDHSTNNEGKLS